MGAEEFPGTASALFKLRQASSRRMHLTVSVRTLDLIRDEFGVFSSWSSGEARTAAWGMAKAVSADIHQGPTRDERASPIYLHSGIRYKLQSKKNANDTAELPRLPSDLIDKLHPVGGTQFITELRENHCLFVKPK